MNAFYKDSSGNIFDKSSMDWKIENGKHDGSGLTEITKNEADSIANPDSSAQLTQSDMIAELNWCDLQMKLHASSDTRAVSTIDDIYAYARACRDYVQNIDGELAIIGDKPVRPE